MDKTCENCYYGEWMDEDEYTCENCNSDNYLADLKPNDSCKDGRFY